MATIHITFADCAVEAVAVISYFGDKGMFFFHSGLNFTWYLAAPVTLFFFLVVAEVFARFGLEGSSSDSE